MPLARARPARGRPQARRPVGAPRARFSCAPRRCSCRRCSCPRMGRVLRSSERAAAALGRRVGARRIAERWRWFAYRVRFHPWTTNELPQNPGHAAGLRRSSRAWTGPIGIWLLLWPTLWAVWIAGRGKPDAHLFVIFVAGTVLMRSAGCAINDYADRSFDPHVERTRERPLAAGRISTDRGAGAVRGAVADGAGACAAVEQADAAVRGVRRLPRGHLPVRQAIPVGAAAVSRA